MSKKTNKEKDLLRCREEDPPHQSSQSEYATSTTRLAATMLLKDFMAAG